jgi:murein L,D-transpeptidase YcbB/YkuD
MFAGVVLLLWAPWAAAAEVPALQALSADDAARIAMALGAAPDEGFGQDAFGLRQALADLNSTAPGRRDAGRSELAEAAIAYASAEHGQRLPAAAFPAEWAIRPGPYDARSDFAAALAQQRIPAWLAALPPSDPAYAPLVEALKHYRALADRGGWPLVPARSRPGDFGPAVAALRARLAVEDPAVGPSGDYDDALKAAVARAQPRFGLEADGVAGPATLAALNVSAQDRVGQIVANLERRRWMPRNPPPVRAEVNIADASLAYFEPGQPPLTMRTVVGKPTWRTPMFADRIEAVVLNPPWNVPDSIARKEVWPKIRANPGYMARERFVVRNGGRLQQLPGPKSSLGLIKFDLGNPFGVYLHDTPAKSLFAKDKRALSHGCMRVEQPTLLALRVLETEAQWPADTVDAAIAAGKTVRIPLKVQPALFVAYWTVLPGADGSVGFRSDIYGWDRALIEKLAAAR